MSETKTLARDLSGLLETVWARRAMPFAWGKMANDCCSFAGACVLAQTGHDALAGLNWNSKAGAMRIIRKAGSLEALMDARLARIAPAAAMRGDVAAVADDELGMRLMVVEGAMLVGPGPDGNRRVPRVAMVAAWSAVEVVVEEGISGRPAGSEAQRRGGEEIISREPDLPSSPDLKADDHG